MKKYALVTGGNRGIGFEIAKGLVDRGAHVVIAARNTPRRSFVSLTIDNDKTPAHPGDSVMLDGKVVGTITSAGWGYRVGQNIAYAFVDPDAASSDGLSVQHVGQMSAANVGEMCRYDPQNALVRG